MSKIRTLELLAPLYHAYCNVIWSAKPFTLAAWRSGWWILVTAWSNSELSTYQPTLMCVSQKTACKGVRRMMHVTWGEPKLAHIPQVLLMKECLEGSWYLGAVICAVGKDTYLKLMIFNSENQHTTSQMFVHYKAQQMFHVAIRAREKTPNWKPGAVCSTLSILKADIYIA